MREANPIPRGEVVFYQSPDGAVELKIRLEQESLWLSQRQMALLFDLMHLLLGEEMA